MDLICGICMEELGSEKEVCSLPCGHVKHIACLKDWSEEQKNCPNCWKRFQPATAIRKRLYFDRDPNSDNQIHGANNETDQNDTVLAITEALRQELDESKAEVDAAQTRIKDLEESIRELERKHKNSEVKLSCKFYTIHEANRQLTAELHTSESKSQETLKRIRELEQKLSNSQAKNQETLERNRELELEVSNSQAKIRDFEAKFEQTNVGRLIKFMEEGCENLKNGELSRLQDSLEVQNNEIARLKHLLEAKYVELGNERKLRLSIAERLGKQHEEAANFSNENAKVKRDLCNIQKRLAASEKEKFDIILDNANVNKELLDIQKRLETAEKQNVETKKEMEKMKEQWQRYRRMINKAAKFGNEIDGENQELTNSQSSRQQSPPRFVTIMAPIVLKRQNQESGSNDDPAKRSHIDIQKKSGQSGD